MASPLTVPGSPRSREEKATMSEDAMSRKKLAESPLTSCPRMAPAAAAALWILSEMAELPPVRPTLYE